MKKLLLLLALSLMLTPLFSQTEEDGGVNDYIEQFTNGEFDEVVLTDVFDAETIASFDDADVQAEMTITLQEAGLDQESIDNTLTVMDLVADGDMDQLSDLDDLQAAGVIDFGTDDISDGIATMIGKQVADELFNSDAGEDMKLVFKTLANGLNMLSQFGQATAQTSVSSSLFGYQDYKLFAVSFGMLGSVAADSDTMSSVNDIFSNSDNISEELEAKLEEGGFSAGFAMQGFTASAGINLGFLIDNLYAGIVFGSLNVKTSGSYADISVLGIPVVTEQDLGMEDLDEMTLSLESSTFGIKANYQLLDGFGIPVLFRWNGISLGTGFVANTFNVNAKLDNLMSLLAGDSESETTFDVSEFKVGAEFGINNTTYTIPLEASTGIQVLSVLTLTAGAGIDLTFGTSSVEFTTIYEDPDALVAKVIDEIINQALIESGTGINFPYNNPGEINLINPRLMAGVGLGIGPAVVDFTIGYYIFSGTTLGINFVLRI